jgi:hypothetical protein
VLVTALAGVGCYAVIAWWFRGKEAQKPDLSRAASGDPITGTQNQTSSSTPRGPSFSK